MDLELSRTKTFVRYLLLTSVVIGFFTESFASDGSLSREITLVNNVTKISGMMSNLNDREANLQLRCAVRIGNEIYLHRSRNIEQGQSHTWKIDHSEKKNNKSWAIFCSMIMNNKFYSLIFGIDEELKSEEPKQDWLLTGDGLQKSNASRLSARWNVNAVDEQNITVNDVDPAMVKVNVLITVTNIMQGSGVKFTRVDIRCVAKTKEKTHFLGIFSIFAGHSHIWRFTQRDNKPDTISCTFHWIDDFHQRYVMDSDVFDSKPRISNNGGISKAVRKKYYLTKSGLAYGQQEVYVAQWTKAVTTPDPIRKKLLR